MRSLRNHVFFRLKGGIFIGVGTISSVLCRQTRLAGRAPCRLSVAIKIIIFNAKSTIFNAKFIDFNGKFIEFNTNGDRMYLPGFDEPHRCSQARCVCCLAPRNHIDKSDTYKQSVKNCQKRTQISSSGGLPLYGASTLVKIGLKQALKGLVLTEHMLRLHTYVATSLVKLEVYLQGSSGGSRS